MEICGRGGRMPAARVEQKNGMTKQDKNDVIPLDKESPIQAVCGKVARTDLRGGRGEILVPTVTITCRFFTSCKRAQWRSVGLVRCEATRRATRLRLIFLDRR